MQYLPELRAENTGVSYYNIRAWLREEPQPDIAFWQYRIQCWNIRDWIDQGEPPALDRWAVLTIFAAPMMMATYAIAMLGSGRR